MKAIVRHTATFYDLLDQDAVTEQVDGSALRIFRGKVTRVYRESGIPQSYYSDVFKQLEMQGCITFLQRGSKSVSSVIVLHQPPSAEGYVPPRKPDLTDAERYANVREDVEGLKTLVGGINIAEALKTIETRIDQLEQQQGEIRNG